MPIHHTTPPLYAIPCVIVIKYGAQHVKWMTQNEPNVGALDSFPRSKNVIKQELMMAMMNGSVAPRPTYVPTNEPPPSMSRWISTLPKLISINKIPWPASVNVSVFAEFPLKSQFLPLTRRVTVPISVHWLSNYTCESSENRVWIAGASEKSINSSGECKRHVIPRVPSVWPCQSVSQSVGGRSTWLIRAKVAGNCGGEEAQEEGKVSSSICTDKTCQDNLNLAAPFAPHRGVFLLLGVYFAAVTRSPSSSLPRCCCSLVTLSFLPPPPHYLNWA